MGDEVWDVMRMRIEEETKKASGASLVVRSDVEELENRLRRVMPSWEAGMSIGNTLRTVTSGHSISRQSTAEGHLEPPFSPITSKCGSNSNGSFSDDFSLTVFPDFQRTALTHHHSSLSNQEVGTGGLQPQKVALAGHRLSDAWCFVFYHRCYFPWCETIT